MHNAGVNFLELRKGESLHSPTPISQGRRRGDAHIVRHYAPEQREKPREGLAVQSPTRWRVTRCETPDTTSLLRGLVWTHANFSPPGSMNRSYLYSMSPG